MNILGIDIGMSGALSFYNGEELMIHDMPIFKVKKGNDLDINKLALIIKSDMPDHVFIEKAMFMPGNGKVSYGKLQKAEGAFLGIFSALDIPYTIVPPATWKKAMQCPKEKDGSRMRASQVFPQFAHNWTLRKDDGKAEASLIAEYGRRQLQNN